jgi:hypothetical protein
VLISNANCSKTVVNFDKNTNFHDPKIIGANHPNSFFDAIVIAVSYPKPIYFFWLEEMPLINLYC